MAALGTNAGSPTEAGQSPSLRSGRSSPGDTSKRNGHSWLKTASSLPPVPPRENESLNHNRGTQRSATQQPKRMSHAQVQLHRRTSQVCVQSKDGENQLKLILTSVSLWVEGKPVGHWTYLRPERGHGGPQGVRPVMQVPALDLSWTRFPVSVTR